MLDFEDCALDNVLLDFEDEIDIELLAGFFDGFKEPDLEHELLISVLVLKTFCLIYQR